MRVFITGGAGFIGSEYVRQLLLDKKNEIERVTVLDKLTYAGDLENLQDVRNISKFVFIHGDICDTELVSQILPGHDTVINFAAESHVDKSILNSSPFVTTNVLGTQNLLDAALKSGIVKFLQVSTDEVYGSIEFGEAKEDTILNPSSPYSASKAAAEFMALSYFYTHGLDVRITRSSNNYGPRQHLEKLIRLFINNIIHNKKVPLYGDGLNVRNWIHVSDNCRGIQAVLDNGAPGNIYNLGGSYSSTNLELAIKLLNHFGKDENEIEYVPDRKGHDRRYSISSEKVKQDLSFTDEISFSDGFNETISWYASHLKY